MLELTLILLAAAAVLFVVLGPFRRRQIDRASDAARKAVEAQTRNREARRS